MAEFLTHLRKCRTALTAQQYRTIKGQALSGDVEGAMKGLIKVISRVEKTMEYREE